MAGDESVAQLILKIVADSSEVRKELQSAVDAEKRFSKDTKESSKEASDAIDSSLRKTTEHAEKTKSAFSGMGMGLRMVSMSMIRFGTMLSGPVVAAIAASTKFSGQARLTMNALADTMKQFSAEIADAALPLVEKFTEGLKKLVDWFSALPKWMKDAIVQFALIAGTLLVVAGTTLYLYRMLLIFWGAVKAFYPVLIAFGKGLIAFLLSPLGLILTALALFTAAWVNNWLGIREITKNVLGWIGKQIDNLTDGLNRLILTWELHAGGMTWKEAWKAAGEAVAETRRQIDEEGGGIEQKLKDIADAAAKAADKIRGLGKKDFGISIGSVIKEATAGFKLGLQGTVREYQNVSMTIENTTKQLVGSLQSTLSTGLFDWISGNFKSIKEYAADFGKTVLKMFVDLIAQLFVYWAITSAMKAMGIPIPPWLGGTSEHEGGEVKKHEGGLVYHLGGLIRKAHEGLGPGEVPIVAQTYEGVLSRNGMATIGGAQALNRINAGENLAGGPTINLVQVIRAWGPEDVYRERKTLSAAMVEELERNGVFRAAMRRYR